MTPRRSGASRGAILALLLAFAWPTLARSQEASAPDEPAIPAPTGLVNDRASVMDEATRAKLESFLDQVKQKTGAEFAVLTVPNTRPLTPVEYKERVFQRWGIGRHGEDDGLLLLVALEEHEVWFETGYGLEGTLPDGLEARIVRERVIPRFHDGDFQGGIVEGVLAASAKIAAEKGVTLEWNGSELRYDPVRSGRRIRFWVVLLVFVVIVILLSRTGGWSSRRRGIWGPTWGGGWGGGGWGGGFGGRSFGGFGGGASGGGGGGGRW
jgi:uncharacterized protein